MSRCCYMQKLVRDIVRDRQKTRSIRRRYYSPEISDRLRKIDDLINRFKR